MRTYRLPAIFIRYVSPKRGADHHPNKHCLHQGEKEQHEQHAAAA